MRTSASIKKDIATFEDLLSAEGLMDDEKAFLEGELKDLKDELKKAEEATPAKKAPAKKSTAKKKAPAKKTTKKKAPAKRKTPAKKEKSFIMFEGKKIFEDDADYCEKLVKAWKARKAKAKKAAGKRKTKPVVQRVTKDIADAATKAVQTISKTEMKDDPKGAVKKIERVQKAAKEFLEALEDVMDDEVTKAQFKAEFEGFDKLVDEIKKYVKKKANKDVEPKKMADGGEIIQHIDERLDREGDIMNPMKKKRLTEIRGKLLHKEKLTEKDTNVLKNEFFYLFADGGTIEIPVFDEKFEKVFKKYNDKDYFGSKEQAERQVESWKRFVEKGDKEAKKYTEEDVRNSVIGGNKARAYSHTYGKLKEAIKNKDKDYLKSVMRHDQNFTKDLYYELTGDKVPSTTKGMIDFIDSKY